MPTIPQSELPVPRSWDEFEDIVADLYGRVWNDPNTRRYGRTGQAQQGVDICGRPARLQGRYAGVQCKRREQGTLTLKAVEAEIAKAEEFKPPLGEYTIATSDRRDARLQEAVRLITQEREAAGKFSVHIAFWEDLCNLLAHPDNRDLLLKHYGDWVRRIRGQSSSTCTSSARQMVVSDDLSSAVSPRWVTQGLYEQVLGGIIAGVIVAVATWLMTKSLLVGGLLAVVAGVGITLIIGGIVRSHKPIAGSGTDSLSPSTEQVSVPASFRPNDVPAIRVDPDDPPISAVRELLLVALTPEELRRLCQDRPDLRPIIARFGPGHGLDDMVDQVVDYCYTHVTWGELLTAVAQASPRQFARFESRLRNYDFDGAPEKNPDELT